MSGMDKQYCADKSTISANLFNCLYRRKLYMAITETATGWCQAKKIMFFLFQ